MKYKGAVAQISAPFHYRNVGNMMRLWFHSQWNTPKGSRFGQVTLSPNHKAFPHAVNGLPKGDMDEALRRLKEQGISPIVCVANAYTEQFPEVHFKGLPKDSPTLSKTDINSYSIYRKIIKQIALRWGSVQNDALIDIAEQGYTGAPQIKKSGMDLINFMQFWNEVNKYNGKNASAESVTGKEYAGLFDIFCNDVWEIDPTMNIISSPTARFDQVWLEDFYNNSIAIRLGTLVFLSVNQYLFGGCSFGQTCNAIKPEDSPLFDQINNWMKDRNLLYFITEHGCNSEKLFDLGYPDYPGLDKFQSQAKFIIDSTNRWLSMSNCEGATFYQLVDDPNEPRFSETGILDKDSTTDPSEKPSYPIVKQAFSQVTPEPPTPTTMKALYSNNPQRTGQQEITAVSVFPVVPFTIEIKDVLPGIEKQLKKDGVIVIARTPESQPPLDVPGTNTDGTSKMVNAGAGNYELTVWKSNVPTVFTFKVQAATPPPVQDSLVAIIVLKADGSVSFTAQDGRTKVIA